VPGNLFTQLDNIDYDEHYSISNESSQLAFSGLKNVLRHRLKSNYGVLLEIGAGTGGFTKGLLTNVKVDQAIITDISSKMLATCRKRVLDEKHLAKDVVFATYSTGEDILPLGSIDCIIGSFVLHHILDYKGFLKKSYKILKKGGSFIFAEPCYKFHHALVLSMVEILESLIGEGDSSDIDLTRLGNWIHELHFNLKYVGDAEVLGEREDKHLFLRDEVEQAAFDAGFELIETIPYGDPEFVNQCLSSYLPQLDLSPDFLEKVSDLFDLCHKKYFDLIERRDAVPAYAFFFEKKTNLMSRLLKNA
jgi:ubiquinone/menaquinone biosynthesis C-methylase UbiE